MVQKGVCRSSFARDGLTSKKRFWFTQFSFKIYDHVFQSDFGTLFNSSNFRFWSRFLVLIEIALIFEIHAIYSHCTTSIQSECHKNNNSPFPGSLNSGRLISWTIYRDHSCYGLDAPCYMTIIRSQSLRIFGNLLESLKKSFKKSESFRNLSFGNLFWDLIWLNEPIRGQRLFENGLKWGFIG